MEKVCKMFQIISQKKITEDIFSLWIEVGDMVKDIRPGQFVSVYCGDGSRLLPRPISICEVAKATKAIRLVYRVVGEGTKELSMMKAEEEVKMILPLGIIHHFHIIADSGCTFTIVEELHTVFDDSVLVGKEKFILFSALDDLFYILYENRFPHLDFPVHMQL